MSEWVRISRQIDGFLNRHHPNGLKIYALDRPLADQSAWLTYWTASEIDIPKQSDTGMPSNTSNRASCWELGPVSPLRARDRMRRCNGDFLIIQESSRSANMLPFTVAEVPREYNATGSLYNNSSFSC